MTPDPETPCVCGHSAKMHPVATTGCEAAIPIGALVFTEGSGFAPGVLSACCPCRRFVEPTP
jgi:hypothetical protein